MSKGNYNKPSRRKVVADYIGQPVETRIALHSFLTAHKMTRPHFERLCGELKQQEKMTTKEDKAQHLAILRATVDDAWLTAEGKEPPKRIGNKREIAEITEEEKLALIRRIYHRAMRETATVNEKELAVRTLGMLIEKREVKHTIDGSFIARNIIAARRQLGEAGYRVAEVPAESRVSGSESCLAPGPGEAADR